MQQNIKEINARAAALIAAYYETPPLAYVHTFGCQQNVNDGEKIKGVLMELGYGMAFDAEEADLVIFNTCAVREHAEQRVFGNVGALKPLKEKNPNLIIGLCGCMVQQQHIVDKIRKSYPYVDLVFGVNAIDRLPELLAARFSGVKKVILDPAAREDINEEIPTRRDSSFKAWLPIMYGCDNFCSYCVVPYVRGRERSRTPEAVLSEFTSLVENGYKDITLLGQNVNSYGKGLADPCDFSDLLEKLCQVPGDYRVRFMTSHPKDATHKLVDIIAKYPQLCHHIHLPVQAGSDRILQLMNRHYTKAQYLDLIRYAKEKIPDATFSSDVIVGFPGESEEEFLQTVDLVKEVGYMQLFTFIYSKRSGTKAAEMADDTPHKTKADRLRLLLDEQEKIAAAMLQPLVGKKMRVLVEGRGRDGECFAGRLANNVLVEFTAPEEITGKFAQIEVTGAKNTVLTGHFISL